MSSDAFRDIRSPLSTREIMLLISATEYIIVVMERQLDRISRNCTFFKV